MLKVHKYIFLIFVTSICFGNSDFKDVYITFENFHEFCGIIPDHIYKIFALAEAEPKILQPCASTIWMMGDSAIVIWQGASLARASSIHLVDSVRYHCDCPFWYCKIELYQNGEFIYNILPPIPGTLLPPVDLNSLNNHWYSQRGSRLPRFDASDRLDRYPPGIGYQIRIVSSSRGSELDEYVEMWSDPFVIVDPLLDTVTHDSSTLWWKNIYDVFVSMFDSGSYGTVTGYVYSADSGAPLPGYRVVVVEEVRIAWADSSGRYSIGSVDTEHMATADSLGVYTLRLPVGTYILTARGDVSVYHRAEGLEILAYSTVNLDFRVPYAEFARFHWDTVSTDSSDELIDLNIRLSAGSSEDLDGLSVYLDGRFVPTDRISDNTYRVSLPRETEQITCYLPSISGRVISLDSTNFSPIGSVEVSTANSDPRIDELCLEDILEGTVSIENEWLPADYEFDRTVIDISELGHPELTGTGLVKARVFFDDSDGRNDWRVVLVYHEKVVVLEENSEPSTFDLGLQTVHSTFSENGKYVIAFDAYGFKHRGGDAVLLNTETGDTIRFDPSPQREYLDPYYVSTEFRITVGNSHPLGHISNDGRYARLDSYPLSPNPIRLNLFNDKMELVHTAFSDRVEFFAYAENYMSPDGSRICLMGKHQDELCLVIMNEEGSVLTLVPLTESESSMGKTITDEDISVIMRGEGFSGVFIYSGQTGELLHHWHGSELINRARRLSPNGSYVSYFLTEDVYGDTYKYIIRELPNGVITFEHEIERETDTKNDTWSLRIGCDLADNGSSLFYLDQGTPRRYVLVDKKGMVLWLSPVRHHGCNDMLFCYLSDDGQNIAYSAGGFIYILNLNQVSDY